MKLDGCAIKLDADVLCNLVGVTVVGGDGGDGGWELEGS